MPLATLGSTLIDAGGMALVIGMAGLLIYRGTRTRPEDADPEE